MVSIQLVSSSWYSEYLKKNYARYINIETWVTMIHVSYKIKIIIAIFSLTTSASQTLKFVLRTYKSDKLTTEIHNKFTLLSNLAIRLVLFGKTKNNC